MEKLEVGKEFNKNDVSYRIIDRSAYYYLAEVSSIDTGVLHSIELGRVKFNKDTTFMNGTVKSAWESIISNELFGSDPHGLECCY